MSTHVVLLHDMVLTFSLTGVMEDQTIHLVKGSGPATGPSSLSPPSAANASVDTGGTTQTTTTSTSQSPGDEQRGFLGSNPDVNNPFLGATTDGTGNGNAGILRMQQQLMSNPEMMVISFSVFVSYTRTTSFIRSTHSHSLPSLLWPFQG